MSSDEFDLLLDAGQCAIDFTQGHYSALEAHLPSYSFLAPCELSLNHARSKHLNIAAIQLAVTIHITIVEFARLKFGAAEVVHDVPISAKA